MKTSAAILNPDSTDRKMLIDITQQRCHSLVLNTEISSAEDLKIEKTLPELLFVTSKIAHKKLHSISRSRNHFFNSILLIEEGYITPTLSDLNPVGYLSKPFHPELLVLTVNNALRIIYSRKYLSRLVAIPTSDGFEFIDPRKVIRCESLINCTRIVIDSPDKDLLSSYNIGEFRKLFHHREFYCPHKSHLINLNYVKKYRREGAVVMSNDPDVYIPVARGKKEEFLKFFKRLKVC